MKRNIGIGIVVLIAVMSVLHTPVRAEVIRSYDAQIAVQKDGEIEVKEKIEYDFEYLYKHGIYREIPYIKKNSDGKEYKLEVKIKSVVDESGKKYEYLISDVNGQMNIKIGDANRTITGLHTYSITYSVRGALSYFSNKDELYWNVTGNEWQIPLQNVSATVRLPSDIAISDIQSICYTGLSGSSQKNCKIISESASTTISTSQLSSNEGLTLVIGFPKGHVAIIEPVEYTAFENTWYGKLLLGLLFGLLGIIALIWYLFLPIYIPLKWYLTGRDPRSESVRIWFDPPQTKKGRKLTPAETGSLVDETVDMKDIFGSIVHLAQRGYFKIIEDKKGEFTFVRKSGWKVDSSLLNFETELLDGLFNGKDECKIKGRDLGSTMELVTNSLYKQVVKDGFFKIDPQTTRGKYYALGGIALFTGNIFLAIVAILFAKFMPAKTSEGAQQASIGKSLKTFLTSQDRQFAFQAKNQMMFEKLLPYAIAFGVERIWADRFKDIVLSNPSWYVGNNSSTFNSIYFANSMHRSVSTFSSAATPTRSSSGFSSGFSSGGGFSGGGGGGGGGGSW